MQMHIHTQQWDEPNLFSKTFTVLQATGIINYDLFVCLQNSEALQHFMDQYGECFSKSWKSTTYTYLI